MFLAVVVVAVLSYRYFAGPGEGPSGSSRAEPRQPATRGRQVTQAMVEVESILEIESDLDYSNDVSSYSAEFDCL